MSVEITSVVVQAKSEGLDDLVSGLKSLVQEAGNSEKATKSFADSQQSSVDAVQNLLTRMQKQVDLLGANTSQTNAYSVALKGATSLEQQMAMMLGAEVDAYKRLAADQTEAIRLNRQMAQAETDAKSAGDAFIASLKSQTATLGMTSQQVKDYNIAQMELKANSLGVSGAAAPMIQSLKDTAVHAGSAHSGMAGITREMIVLTHEMSQGQFSRFGGSMLVMAEKINFVPATIRTATAAMTAMGVGIGVFLGIVAAAIAVLAVFALAIVAAFKGAAEQKAFNNALLETGNFAGTTGTQLEQMAKSAAGLHNSIGAAKTVVLELAESGKFTADQIGYISKAIVEFEHVTGKSGKEITKDFEEIATLAITSSTRSTNVLTEHAKKLNDHWHYLTSEQYLQIESLEKLGKAQEAAALSTKFLADEVEHRTASMATNLGSLQRAWAGVARWAGEAWDAMLSVGKKKTPEDEVKRLADKINELAGAGTAAGVRGGATFDKKEMAGLLTQIVAADKVVQDVQLAARNEGAKKLKDQAEIHAHDRLQSMAKQYDKIGAAKVALAEFDKDLETVSEADRLKNAQFYADARLALVAKTHEKIAKVRGVGMTGVNTELKDLEAQASSEQDVYNSRLKMVETYHKYGFISDKEFADAKIAVYADMVGNTTKYYDLEIKKLQDFNGKTQSERNIALGDISKLQAKKAKLIAEAQANSSNAALTELGVINMTAKAEQDKALKNIEAINKQTQALKFQNAAYLALPDSVRKAGLTEKAMQDEITQQRIEALEKEKSALEAGVDAESVSSQRRLKIITEELIAERGLKDAQTLREAQTAANSEALKLTAHEKSLSLASAMEKAYTDAFKGMEDALVTFVQTGKLDFSSLANSIIADLVRIQIRQAMGSSAGGGSGLIGMGMSLLGLLGGSPTVGLGEAATASAGTLGFSASAGMNLGSLSLPKASGGFANAGTVGEVNEKGPELFTSGGKQYLMTGSEGGTVTPNSSLGGSNTTVTYSPVINIDARSDAQQVQMLVSKAVQNGNAQLVERLSRTGAIR